MFLIFFALISAHAQDLPTYIVPTILVTPASANLDPDPDLIVEVPDNATPKAATLDDVLRGVPGVTVARSGGVGQPSTLFLRGASSEHTLVLLDGVEVNDPSQPSGGFNFSSVDLNLVERVEVLKGPQTLRFGSGAIGGVINIVTKRGEGSQKFIAAVRAGSHETNRESLAAVGEGYAVSVTRFESAGISASKGGSEKDGHEHLAAAARISSGNWEFINRTLHSRSDLDYATSTTGPYFLAADDPNYFVGDFQTMNAIKRRSIGDHWSSEASLAHFYLQRRYENKPDSANPAYFLENRFANTVKAEQIFATKFRDANLSFGPSLRHEETKYGHTLSGIFAEISRKTAVLASAGVRFDHHSAFGGHFTYSLGTGYKWKEERAKVEVRMASAFKSPSLFQLNDATFGNKDLQPEKVRGEEVSAEKFVGESHAFRATAFRYFYSDLIQFSTRYNNLSTARSQGVELEYSKDMEDGFELQLAYTYTDARNEQDGARLLRRPFQSWRAGVAAKLSDQLSARAEYRGVGSRPDIDALSFASVTAEQYDLVDISVSYAFRPSLTATVSVENAFSRDYAEVAGYSAPRFGAFVGLRSEL